MTAWPPTHSHHTISFIHLTRTILKRHNGRETTKSGAWRSRDVLPNSTPFLERGRASVIRFPKHIHVSVSVLSPFLFFNPDIRRIILQLLACRYNAQLLATRLPSPCLRLCSDTCRAKTNGVRLWKTVTKILLKCHAIPSSSSMDMSEMPEDVPMKRYKPRSFAMGFGKRAAMRNFNMGFGKRSAEPQFGWF